MKTKTGWHFIDVDRRLRYGDGRTIVPGETLRYEGDESIALCERGMHASARALDALKYAPGPVACYVTVGGHIIEDTDKFVGEWRRVEWMVDATEVLHEFACRCAEDALALVHDPDPRSVAAIEAKRAWLRGDIDDAALAVARDAARAAALDAAWDAALDAAWDAAWVAPRAAAWAAAWAAWDTAWDAAWAAAWDAAWAAPRAAPRAAARDKQNRRLTAMLAAARRTL